MRFHTGRAGPGRPLCRHTWHNGAHCGRRVGPFGGPLCPRPTLRDPEIYGRSGHAELTPFNAETSAFLLSRRYLVIINCEFLIIGAR